MQLNVLIYLKLHMTELKISFKISYKEFMLLCEINVLKIPGKKFEYLTSIIKK